MRFLEKLSQPVVLLTNNIIWLNEFILDRDNKTKRYRYRHPDIKSQLKVETGKKCIYCESKIGHNTPGDIEHIIPTSRDVNQHFIWENLTIACTECNRRKNDYYERGTEFLNPYLDNNIENQIQHRGPIVEWQMET